MVFPVLKMANLVPQTPNSEIQMHEFEELMKEYTQNARISEDEREMAHDVMILLNQCLREMEIEGDRMMKEERLGENPALRDHHTNSAGHPNVPKEKIVGNGINITDKGETKYREQIPKERCMGLVSNEKEFLRDLRELIVQNGRASPIFAQPTLDQLFVITGLIKSCYQCIFPQQQNLCTV